MQRLRLGRGRALEFEQREHDDYKADRGHEEAEDDIARGLDPGLAAGEAAGVYMLDGAVANDERDVGHGVEDGVGHGGEEGEGAPARDGAVDLQGGEDDVGGEGAADRDLVF